MTLSNITPDDISPLFRFFRIPTPLYEQLAKYATAHNQTLRTALAELLHYTNTSSKPKYLYIPDRYRRLADYHRVGGHSC